MHRRRSMASALTAVAALLVASAPAAAEPRGKLSLVTVALNGGPADNYSTPGTGVSAHGRYIVFASAATNLVAGDTNDQVDVFVRDTVGRRTMLVSQGNGGVASDGESRPGNISADGRYVVFESAATTFAAGDDNGTFDVFVRDLVRGTTTLVSAGPDGPAELGALRPDISADGRYVAFDSASPNLIAGDTNATSDVFVRDLAAGHTERVSVTPDGGQSDYFSSDPSISAHGTVVAFTSSEALVPGPPLPFPTDMLVYARDRQRHTTVVLSRDVPVDPRSFVATSSEPAISDNGRYVVFNHGGSLGVGVDPVPNVWLRDLRTGRLELISADYRGEPSTMLNYPAGGDVSADGRFVAFTTRAPVFRSDTDGLSDAFVKDRQSGSLIWITRGQQRPYPEVGNGAYGAAISADGRHVSFASDLDLLNEGPPPGVVSDRVFAWDRVPPR
ncbi:TolB family protein [Actinoplanes sp. CA-051413]|uniref:TolB family protein n=1 Tax=Actinoplanes sp. CA-051413 TaxID=3239899 RepID=UPI003D985CFD